MCVKHHTLASQTLCQEPAQYFFLCTQDQSGPEPELTHQPHPYVTGVDEDPPVATNLGQSWHYIAMCNTEISNNCIQSVRWKMSNSTFNLFTFITGNFIVPGQEHNMAIKVTFCRKNTVSIQMSQSQTYKHASIYNTLHIYKFNITWQ